MSKEADKLRERKIYNDYDIANRGDKFWIELRGKSKWIPTAWAVYIVDKHFKGAAWYDNGARTFSYISKEQKQEAFKKAVAFASRETLANCKIWIKTPFGGYVTKNTADIVGFKYTKKAIIISED